VVERGRFRRAVVQANSYPEEVAKGVHFVAVMSNCDTNK